MIAHFFDINSLITVDNKVWIVDKDTPSKPLIKITKSEFNLIKKGIYKKYDTRLKINGIKYWLPENLFDEIKIKCKNLNYDITNLAFSMQEFLNKDIIENLDYKVYIENFHHLKNKTDDVYIICSKKAENSYSSIIEKLKEELEKIGIKIKKVYYLSETFYNRNEDDIAYKKIRTLLQHSIGLKTDGDKFTEEEINQYNTIYYYDSTPSSIELSSKSNYLLSILIKNSNPDIKDIVKNELKEEHVIITREVTFNKVNKFKDYTTNLVYTYIQKTFESFLFKR